MSAPYSLALFRRLERRVTRASGFTLIELLTVIAIIGILATILIPVVGRVRRSASSAQCAAHMRQIGTAMQLFVEDNKGKLPSSATYGALFTGQGPWFNRDDRRLQMVIGNYLNSPKGTTWSNAVDQMNYDPHFAWPALLSQGQPGSPSVILNAAVKVSTTTSNVNPWAGRLQREIRDASTQSALTEVDQKNTTAGWKDMTPPEPIHGAYRNTLFFDWHVAKVPVNG